MVSYLDQLMKSGTKGLNETETEKKLDDIITIFQYIEDKDVFIQVRWRYIWFCLIIVTDWQQFVMIFYDGTALC